MRKRLLPVLAIMISIIMIMVSTLPAYAVKNDIDFKTNTNILYLVNLDTDTVVYSKNSDKKCYPASTTKIMTYIIVTESVKDLENTKVEIDEDLLAELDGTDSSLSGLSEYVGKELSVYQLLNCMMISSGNDAALVLADFVGDGDVDAFVKKMNQKAKELGCKNTSFVNPHGLHDEKQYTTAEDMLKITRCAMTEPYFMDITSTVEYYINGDDEEPLTNTNSMLNPDNEGYYYEYVKGIKTGTTDEAGHCLVSTALKDNVSYMCIAYNAPCYDEDGYTLDTNYAMVDTKNLYDWAFSNVTMREVLSVNDELAEIKVNYGDGAEKVKLVPEYSFSTMLSKKISDKDVKITVQCQEEIDAPVKKGTVLGTATVEYNGEELAKVNLVTDNSIEKSNFAYFMVITNNIISSQVFIIMVGIIAVLLVVYITILIVRNSKRKSENK